jgi:DNA-binding transcriptional LysR family regulator
MELRHLRYFITVAEELNFCRAAERLRIAQPPLSVQIRQLEEELGTSLFYRVKRRLTLSPAGEVLFTQGRRLLQDTEQVVDQVKQAAQGKTGRLSIGFVGTAMYDILPAALKLYRAQFPAVHLTLEDLHTCDQIRALREQKIDIGFLRPPVDDDSLEFENVIQESLMVALPEKHRFNSRHAISLSELRHEPFLICPANCEPTLYRLYRALFHEAGFEPQIVQEATHIQTQIGLVAAGVGICLVPSSVTKLCRDGVIYHPISSPEIKIAKAMVWRKGPIPANLAGFIKAVRQASSMNQTTEMVHQVVSSDSWKTAA